MIKSILMVLPPRAGKHLHTPSICGRTTAHALPRPHHLINQQQLIGKDGGQIQTLALHADVIPDSLVGGDHGIARLTIETHGKGTTALLPLVGKLQDAVLHVKARVFGQRLGNDQESLRVCFHAQLGPALGGLGHLVAQIHGSGQLEGTATGNHGLVLDGILDGPQPIAETVLDLVDRVLVGSPQQESAALGMAALLDEGELVLADGHLADLPGEANLGGVHILKGMDGRPAAGQGQPFHVPSLGPAEAEDALLGEQVEGERVDALLVDHDERLPLLAHRPLEVDDRAAPLVEPLALGLDELLPLLGVGVEEAGLDLGLLVLEGDVARHDVAVVEDLGHVGMAAAVVEDEAVDEARVGAHLLLHVHDLDALQVEGGGEGAVHDLHVVGVSALGVLLGGDALDGVHHGLGHLLGQLVVELGLERGGGDAPEQVAVLDGRLAVLAADGDLELVEEFEGGVAGDVVSVRDDAGVQPLGGVSVGLPKELAAKEDGRRGSVSRDVVLLKCEEI